jgi:hypothetical protein
MNLNYINQQKSTANVKLFVELNKFQDFAFGVLSNYNYTCRNN